MSTLKKSDREEVLRAVLTETFKPQFEDIARRLQIDLRAHLVKEHPRFLELLKDQQSVRYVATGYVRDFKVKVDDENTHTMKMPEFGLRASMPNGRYMTSGERSAYRSMSDPDTVTPSDFYQHDIHDSKLIKAYVKLWESYVAAYDKLATILRSYTTQEKFVEDFHEFDKYLPEPTVKAHPPAVIVKTARAELRKLGIPSK